MEPDSLGSRLAVLVRLQPIEGAGKCGVRGAHAPVFKRERCKGCGVAAASRVGMRILVLLPWAERFECPAAIGLLGTQRFLDDCFRRLGLERRGGPK